jgi:hypothetical protein
MKQNQTRMSLEPHNCIGDHVPLNDALVASNVNDIAMECEGTADYAFNGKLLDHRNYIKTHHEKQHRGSINEHVETLITRMPSSLSQKTILSLLRAM